MRTMRRWDRAVGAGGEPILAESGGRAGVVADPVRDRAHAVAVVGGGKRALLSGWN